MRKSPRIRKNMTKEDKLQGKRVELSIPMMPSSLRGFIEKIIRDDRAFESLIESPATTLAAAGLPLKVDGFTGRDYVRLIMVLGNIRTYVKENKIDRAIRFEDLFGITSAADLANTTKQTNIGENKNFDRSEPSKVESKGSNTGATKTWSGVAVGLGLDEVILTAPLLNPSDLADILSRIDEGIEAKRRIG
jgi:hypothetical protein